MNSEFESSEVSYGSEFDAGDSGITRKLIMRYIAAGILFPEEIRQAEEILRHLNKKSG